MSSFNSSKKKKRLHYGFYNCLLFVSPVASRRHFLVDEEVSDDNIRGAFNLFDIDDDGTLRANELGKARVHIFFCFAMQWCDFRSIFTFKQNITN